MEASDWIALGALVVAAAALVYARLSAVSARRSADEAERLSGIEAERRTEEKERWHHEREPDLPGEIEAEYRDSPGHGPSEGALWGTVTVPHMYRVRAFAISGPSWSPISLESVTQPGRPMEFMFERWPHNKEAFTTEEVLFRFWPPVEGDAPAVWACGCGRPAAESAEGPGHWERRVRVTYQRPFAAWT